MKQIILGTAGHIDHGKTSLIRAITGIDTDRLKEEKRRGITIELGFASLNLPGGLRLGVVDVPGHEKFVKNMVAGATGIDIVALVIAADEGVMPQTREHLEICTLLGVRHGLVVLTKIDMVDEEILELAKEDVSEFVRGTFLEDSPVMEVSSVTGKGLDDFKSALAKLGSTIPERVSSGLFRLPIDRVFTMKGFGTVITGTLVSGRVHLGDTVMIYPHKIRSKVRGLQVHNASVESAEAGMRTAVNFQGLEKTAVERGDVLSVPEALIPGYMVDVEFIYLQSNKKPLKNRRRVRFHTGTSEVLGILVLLEKEEISPGETSVAQIRLDRPLAVMKDDRFVVRSYSPLRTLGGGRVINPIPPKHKRFKPDVLKNLRLMLTAEGEDLVLAHLSTADLAGTDQPALSVVTNLPDKKLDKILQGLLSAQKAVLVDREKRTFVHAESFGRLKQMITGFLETFHRENKLKPGMALEELRTKIPDYIPSKLADAAINRLIQSGELDRDKNRIRLSSHKVNLEEDQEKLLARIRDIYAQGGLAPPRSKELRETLKMDENTAKAVLSLMVEQEELIKIKEDLLFDPAHIRNLENRVLEFFQNNSEMTTPQFKDMAKVSRKYLIPLIEYFDATNLTIRVGDIRKLRKKTN